MKVAVNIIEELANRPGVKRIAVENFLLSLSGLSRRDAIANLSLDARLYKWNMATKKAITEGIRRAI